MPADLPADRAGTGSPAATDGLAGRRIALVLATSTGGVGRHVRSLAAGLVDRQARVAVLGPSATEQMFSFSGVGAAFSAVEVAAGLRPVADLRAVLRLRRLVRGADLVHAHGLRAGLVAALALAGRADGPPLVVTWHNAVLAGGRRRLLQAMEAVVARRARLTLCVSTDLVERVRELGGRDVRLVPAAAPVLDVPRRPAAEVRRELGVADGQPLLLTLARLHPQKGLDVLIDASVVLGRRLPSPLVVVAGEGPLADELAARIAATSAPVRLLGARDDIAELLAAADVVVVPSRWEGSPLAVQEAMRAGRPLVASAVGGIVEMVGDDAVLVAAEDHATLAVAVGSLLDDPAAAARLGERGRARAATWPTERDTVATIADLYTDLLEGHR